MLSRKLGSRALLVLALLLDFSLPGGDAGASGRGPFHPRDAEVRDEKGHRYVWRERCGNNIPGDHQLAGWGS